MIRRHGSPDAFWGTYNDVTPSLSTFQMTGASGTSNAVRVGQAVENFVAFVHVQGSTTITIQVAPTGHLTADGNNPTDDANPPADPNTWFTLYEANNANAMAFALGGGESRAINFRGLSPGWVRLVSSNNVPALAGYEVTGY